MAKSELEAMKVVLFCGGLGTRLREHSDTIPKPLVNIGIRPIIWHLMRYYAHYGHKDFVLALGYRGDMIREYFLNYNECLSNDFTLSEGGARIEAHTSDISDWRITFADTGMHSTIAERLLKVRKYVEGEPAFLANYADGLSDVPIDRMVADFEEKRAVWEDDRCEEPGMRKVESNIPSKAWTAFKEQPLNEWNTVCEVHGEAARSRNSLRLSCGGGRSAALVFRTRRVGAVRPRTQDG